MASVKLIAEDEATGEVKALYDEIRAKLGTDFVPNLYRAMAPNPEHLEANLRTNSRRSTSWGKALPRRGNPHGC